jgi:tritrans,polycis-undecaprenyl-diphosphate synthase [geranylgeranyl-diphosphate specific]
MVFSQLTHLTSGNIPAHVGIIMDGNRRAARIQGREPIDGHVAGRTVLEDVVRWAGDVGVKYLTVYAFSIENFQRPEAEVDGLYALFAQSFTELATSPEIRKNKVKIRAIGDLDRFPTFVRQAVNTARRETLSHEGLVLTVCMAYDGEDEVLRAIRKMLSAGVRSDELSKTHLRKRLDTVSMPDVDLLIRTSGEQRLSGFLPLLCAYAELYFTEVKWPNFGIEDFVASVESYQARQRRLGR